MATTTHRDAPRVAQAEVWREAILHGQRAERQRACEQVAQSAASLLEADAFEPVLAAAALGDDGHWAKLSGALAEADDERLVERWDASEAVRLGGLLLALRRPWEMRGHLRDFLLGELESIGESPRGVERLAAALELLSELAPQRALWGAGLCSEVAVKALLRMEPSKAEALLRPYAAQLAKSLQQGQLPDAPDAHVLLVLDLLASELGERLVQLLAVEGLGSEAKAAAVLARVCAELAMALPREDGSLHEGGEGEPLRADPEILRGLFDALQLAYEDRTGDSWTVRLRYRDVFRQWKTASMFVGLTGNRVVLRVHEPGGGPAPLGRARELLQHNHHSGLARYSCDLEGRVCVTAEVPRDGFTPSAFEQAVQDLTQALEKLVGAEG
jgi:hypothetical protein